MIIDKRTYIDYNGNERTEEFLFNLNKAEVVKLENSRPGGFVENLRRAIDAQDIPTLMEAFEELILKSYGVKSPDGKGFVKRKELTEAYASTEAYSDLYIEILQDAEKAKTFFNGVMPKAETPSVPAPADK